MFKKTMFVFISLGIGGIALSNPVISENSGHKINSVNENGIIKAYADESSNDNSDFDEMFQIKKLMREQEKERIELEEKQAEEKAQAEKKAADEKAKIEAEKAIEEEKVRIAEQQSAEAENIAAEKAKTETSQTETAPSGRTLVMESTAYSSDPADTLGGGTITATGQNLLENPMAVAVDPSVIPLGTKLYVEGYGEAYAVDTGGAIKGDNIIDVHFPTAAQCIQWGRRTVTVTILS